MKSKDLPKLIPTKVRITRKISYEVVYTDDYVAEQKLLGQCRPEPAYQIVIYNKQSDTEKYKTFLHETIHAINFETEGLNMTENQVAALEQGLFRVLKLNGILDTLFKK